jgi:hypothetical protein
MKKRNLSISSFRLIGFLFFATVLFFAINGIGGLLTEYDDIQKRWNYFYELPKNSLDILILGNSHAYSTYDPNIIDAICQTNSYVLAANSQKLEQTFFNLKEALKSQNPKIVVIQASVLTGDTWKTHNGDYRVYSNLDGMRFSKNKLDAIKAQRPLKDYSNTLFSILHNHENWKMPKKIKENAKQMIWGSNDDYRGFSPRYSEMDSSIMKKFKEAPKTDFSNYKLTGLELDYLKKIKELANKNHFKVVYVMSPKYPDIINQTYTKKFNKINEVISDLNQTYVDFNKLEQEIGLENRSFENGFIAYQHTSNFGAIQVSKYLANYLKKEFLNPSITKVDDTYWKARMLKKKEYFLYNHEAEKGGNAIYNSSNDFIFFDSVVVDNVFIFRKAENKYDFVIEFKEGLNTSKISEFKFYFHLYPDDQDFNIKVESREHGFENYDFHPVLLPRDERKFYLVKELNTEIKKIKKINLGLYKSGTSERSAEFKIKKINLD